MISLCEAQCETDVPIIRVMGKANNTIKRMPLDEFNALCDCLDCEVGKLLKREEVAA